MDEPPNCRACGREMEKQEESRFFFTYECGDCGSTKMKTKLDNDRRL